MNNNLIEETAFLSKTIEFLTSLLNNLEKELEKAQNRLKNTRKEAYEESAHTIRSFDDVAEISIAEQEVNNLEKSLSEIVSAIKRAVSQLDSPYFGRIDFNDGFETIPVYIGKYGLYDTENHLPLVVDWRSPVASMFYDFGIGPAWYTSPNGRLDGHIDLKRQFKITKSRIDYMFESDLTVNDELLGRTLSESGGERLKIIVSSIQREQNAAIRHNSGGTLIVHGPAGSGKTSVGMHRLAWLLYHDRNRLSSEDIVIISSNAVFSSYITNVLPELGEVDVKRPLFDDLANSYAPDGYKFTSHFEQISYVSCAEKNNMRLKEIEVKYSQGFLFFIESFFKNFTFRFTDIIYNDNYICTAERLSSLPLTENGRYPFDVALRRILSYIKSSCDDYFKQHERAIKQNMSDKRDEIMFDSEINMKFREITRSFTQNCIDNFSTANKISDEITLYTELLECYIQSLPDFEESKQIISIHKKRVNEKQLLYEDLMLILRIKALFGNIEPQRQIKSVLIDEAQDYCLPQLLFIKHLYEKSSLTILADPNQAVYPSITTPDLETIRGVFPGAESIYLQNSYRCTRQIYDFARSYTNLPALSGFAREGPEPEFIEYDIISDILKDCTLSGGTTGIITSTALNASKLHKKLGKSHRAALVSAPEDNLSGGTVILPVALVKGLEFDNVVLADDFRSWDSEFYGSLMYTLSTRALHRLYIVTDD